MTSDIFVNKTSKMTLGPLNPNVNHKK